MKASKLTGVIQHAIKHTRSLLIVGSPGIGKSDICQKAAALEKADCLIMHPSVADPTDFKGMPALVNNGKTTAEFLPFGDLRKLCEAKKKTVVLIDDLIQAPTSVQAALMQLILARQVNGKRISDQVVFLGATNDVSDRAGGTNLIEPLKSRWDTILKLDLNVDDWCVWALDNQQPSELVAFIRLRPELLCKFTPTREIKSYPCPRTWASVGRWFNEGMVDHEVYSGVVGEGPAVEFIAFLQTLKDAPSLDAILLNPDTAPLPTKPGIMYLVVSGLARKADKGNFGRVLRYTSRLPKEFDVCCVRDATRVNPALTQTAAFVKWGTDNAEVLA